MTIGSVSYLEEYNLQGVEGNQELNLPTKTSMERNLDTISPTERRFYRQIKDFVDQLKIKRPTHDKLEAVTHPT